LGAAIVCVAACGFEVNALSPQPNIALPSKAPSFDLVLAPTVLDTYEVPQEAGVMGGTVKGWRASLETGFHNAFPSHRADDKVTLTIEQARFSVVPAAVDAMGHVVSARGQIQYRGRWTHGEHDEIPFSGMASSKQTTTHSGDAPLLARTAIETMYEQVWATAAGAAATSAPSSTGATPPPSL
jgi:hypothetical protein